MNAHQREFKEALPDALDQESALLGALLVSNDVYWRVAGFLKPEHFTEPLHKLIYDTAGKMIAEGRTANPLTMKPYVPAEEAFGQKTVAHYLATLAGSAVTVINAYEYGRAIVEMWARHRLISVAADLDQMARNMPVDMNPEKIIGEVAGRLTQIAQEGNERAGSVRYGVILPNAVDKAAKASGDAKSRIPWFLPEISAALGDIRRGNLIGCMSDSGGGKTSFSLQQCRFAASQGFKSAFFSIEITDEEAALQAAAQAAHVELGRLDAWTVNSKEQGDIENEMIASTDLPFFIVGFGECSLSDIRIKAEAMVKSQGLDLIIIDHAKMITLPGSAKELFAERINALYRGLKALAKTLNVAIVILIQRNDDWKARVRSGGTPRPITGDAYGGGSIRQSLDVWFSLYRPEPLYKELIGIERNETKRNDLIKRYDASRGNAVIVNHKRRRGEPGLAPTIRFIPEHTSFASDTTDDAPIFEGFDP
jgi:replicative DNA helicase